MRIGLGVIAMAAMLMGAPALQVAKEFKQNDGSAFHGVLHGDEWFHWVDTRNGYAVKYNPSSRNYEYIRVIGEGDAAHYEFSGVRVPADIEGHSADAPAGVEKVPMPMLQQLWKNGRGVRR
jgi:hypothetical protein